MIRLTLVLALFFSSLTVNSQTAQPVQATPLPQTARQALLEAFFGQGENHLERHLPEVAKKAFRQLDASSPNFRAALGFWHQLPVVAPNLLKNAGMEQDDRVRVPVAGLRPERRCRDVARLRRRR